MILSLSSMLNVTAALACLIWSAMILLAGHGRTAWPLAGACIAASLWLAAAAIAVGEPPAPLHGLANGLEILRSLAWLAVLLLISRRLSSWTAPRAGGFILAGGVAAAIALGVGLPWEWGGVADLPRLGSPSLLALLALNLLVVVVAENLYRNAPEECRWHLILPCVTLGGLAAFDVVLQADAVLGRAYSPALLDARAVLTALAMPLLIIAALRDRRWRRMPVMSRQLVFHGATLVVAGTFLIGVGAAGEALRHWGADWSLAAQASLLAAAVMLLVLLLASRSMRSRLRGLVVDHFFAARYDYRREWLRCVATLSDQGARPETRAITAIADAVDSPAGKLLLRVPGEPGLQWVGSWNMAAGAAQIGDAHPLMEQFRSGQHVVAPLPIPGGFWMAVPLLHHSEGLLGIVLLAPPRATFALDAEVFDLLRSVGRAVAMFMAERQAAAVLAEQRDVQSYAQRFAFVAHDVKTVASQLTMMLANAEQHIAEPAFQADMLLTVAASASRINTLIARLRQPEEATAPAISPLERITRLVRGHSHPISLYGEAEALVAMAPERFDAAILHLLDNAAEASPRDAPVRIRLDVDAAVLIIDITDNGPGMSPGFIRDSLFRPLRSGRTGGNGIGAWQARDLLRSAGGDLTVISAPQHGTTMRIALPVVAAPCAQGPAPALHAAPAPALREHAA